MNYKSIIPCLDVKEGRVVKGVNFVDFKDAGDPVAIAKAYSDMGADQLVFLDITATLENRNIILDLVKKVTKVISIPLSVGGGIRTISDFSDLLESGASKVSVNTAALNNPSLIKEASKTFGSQHVIVAIDVKKNGDYFEVYVNGGHKGTGINAINWAKEACDLGAGEILLTSMDRDGCKNGYDLEVTRLISEAVPIPVIASGGAGLKEHFLEAFTIGKAQGALAASLFHFNEINLRELKQYLAQNSINVRI